jgi:hypothetical protein
MLLTFGWWWLLLGLGFVVKAMAIGHLRLREGDRHSIIRDFLFVQEYSVVCLSFVVGVEVEMVIVDVDGTVLFVGVAAVILLVVAVAIRLDWFVFVGH